MDGAAPLILVVADGAEDERELRLLLEAGGYRTAVPDGGGAFGTAVALHPALVLADLMLPRFEGAALCRALRHDPRTLGVAVVLATGAPPALLGDLLAGCQDAPIVRKPWSSAEVLATIAALVGPAPSPGAD